MRYERLWCLLLIMREMGEKGGGLSGGIKVWGKDNGSATEKLVRRGGKTPAIFRGSAHAALLIFRDYSAFWGGRHFLSMLLAIDIGNTNIVLGIWHGREWLLQWRLSTVRERTADEYAIYIKGLLRERKLKKRVKRVVMSSVVPQLTRTFDDMCRRYLKHAPLIVNHQTDLGLEIAVDFPDQVGADRLVNCTAVYHHYQTACIVIDMGTATKFDVVNAQGQFIGGVISPGLQITADALFQRAAKLSQVEFVAPPQVIGRNTIHAIQSGLVFGYTGQIEGVLPRLKKEMRQQDPSLTGHIPVVGTGGLINLIAPHTNMIDVVDPWLTLGGLQLIDERNRGGLGASDRVETA